MIIYLVVGLFVGTIIFSGFETCQEQERRVIESFGKYSRTLQPGLNWILPLIMKVRITLSTWEQSLPLFEEPVKIDFQDGSATPKGSEVFVKIKDPDTPYKVDKNDLKEKATSGTYRATYEIKNWKTAIKNLIENVVRTYLNGLTIDEGLAMKEAGFDLKNKFHDSEKPELKKELLRVEKTLSSWGFELERITIMDFDLEDDLVKARGEVQKKKREAEASEEERRIRALETVGSMISMISLYTGKSEKEIQKKINKDEGLNGKMFIIAEDLVKRRMSIDGNALTDIIANGGGGIKESILEIIGAFKKI